MLTKNRWGRQKTITIPILVIGAAAGMLLAYFDVQAARVRHSIVKFLDAPDGNFEVTVNGSSWGSDRDLLGAIRHIHFEPGHHSHPEHEIFVAVQGKRGKLEVVLARDSGNANEYWVFWTKEAGKESRREIGRVETFVLSRE